jgi:allophanate hydrolase subunit 1
VTLALEPFGDSAWRVRLPETTAGRAVLDALRVLPGVVDAVVSERHALVVFDPQAPPAGIADAVEDALAGPSRTASPREHTIRARYDGLDLAEMAAGAGIAPREIASLHAGVTYVVAAIGFLPGFAYLRGLHRAWSYRDDPRRGRVCRPSRSASPDRTPACTRSRPRAGGT